MPPTAVEKEDTNGNNRFKCKWANFDIATGVV